MDSCRRQGNHRRDQRLLARSLLVMGCKWFEWSLVEVFFCIFLPRWTVLSLWKFGACWDERWGIASWLQRQKLSSLRRLRRCVEECIRSKVLRSSYWRDPLVYSTQQLFWLCLVIFFNCRLKRGEVICSFSVDGSGSVNFRYMSTPLPLCSGVFGVLCTCKA